MRYLWLILICVLSSLVLVFPATAQSTQPVNPPSSDKPGADITPETPVITIEGACPKPTSANSPAGSATDPITALPLPIPSGSGCKIVVTRAEFEKITSALPAGAPNSVKINFAKHYAEILLMTQTAHESGFDQDPKVQAKAKMGYLQLMSQSFIMQLRQKAQEVSDEQVASYYHEHPEAFEQVDLMRVFIPSQKVYSTDTAPSKQALAADKIELQAEAEKVHRQAVAGADFQRLENRVYKLAGNSDNTPEAHLGLKTRADTPEQYRDMIFALKIGQVSDLVSESNGWSSFEVVARKTIPLSEAKPQVQKLKAEAAVNAIKNSAKTSLNDAYFGSPGSSTTLPQVK